jgi:hypothetical protein
MRTAMSLVDLCAKMKPLVVGILLVLVLGAHALDDIKGRIDSICKYTSTTSGHIDCAERILGKLSTLNSAQTCAPCVCYCGNGTFH